MPVYSLLTLAYSKSNITYTDVINSNSNSLERDIYNKVVLEVSSNISSIISNHRTKLIVKAIYLIKTKGIMEMISILCHDIESYRELSLWRIAMILAVINWHSNKTDKDRIKYLLDISDMLLVDNSESKIRLNKYVSMMKKTKEIDLSQYIRAYLIIGSRLR